MIKLKLKDGSIMEVEQGSSILDVAKKISEGLARVATCGEINGDIKDLRYEINEDCDLVIHTFQDDDLEGKKAYWHTTSHIMAQAIKRLYGNNIKLTIGPSIENGFYYDFDIEKSISENEFEKIEEEKTKIESGEWDVFTGPIETNTGEVIDPEGKGLDDATITGGINWYFKNIVEK